MFNPLYIGITLSMSVLFWVTTGVQYWFSDYLIREIKVPSETVFVAFSVIMLTAAIFGVLAGGWAVSYLGGYNDIKSFYFILTMAVASIFVALPIPMLDSHI